MQLDVGLGKYFECRTFIQAVLKYALELGLSKRLSSVLLNVFCFVGSRDNNQAFVFDDYSLFLAIT